MINASDLQLNIQLLMINILFTFKIDFAILILQFYVTFFQFFFVTIINFILHIYAQNIFCDILGYI